jgi:predicted sulfurtransferase
MKRKNLISVWIILLLTIIFYLLFIRKNSYEIWTDIKLFENNKIEETNNKTRVIIQNTISSQKITIEEIVSWVKNWNNIDNRFIWTNKSWNKINIFSKIDIKNNLELKNLVIEDSLWYNSTGIELLTKLKWNYIILKWEWYRRTINVVKWP